MEKDKKLKEKSDSNTTHHNYKFDDSAIRAGRKKIGVRVVGEQVDPKNMTHKEYVHYLCYLFDFKLGKGWDGIEQNKYQYNWTPEESHNVETAEEALDFLGIETHNKAPDGLEKRNKDRRAGIKDSRKDKEERRLARERRKYERRMEGIAGVLHVTTLIVGIITYSILWSIAK